MGRRIVARREHGAPSGGRGVGALAISGNAPLFAMTCLGDKNVLKSESILLVVSFFCLWDCCLCSCYFMFRIWPVRHLERSGHLLEVSSNPSTLLTGKQTIDGPKSSSPRCPFKSTDSIKTAAQTVATCMSRAQETATEKCQSILGALLALFILVVMLLRFVVGAVRHSQRLGQSYGVQSQTPPLTLCRRPPMTLFIIFLCHVPPTWVDFANSQSPFDLFQVLPVATPCLPF